MVYADKPTPQVQKLENAKFLPITPVEIAPMFRAGDTCTVNHAGDPTWYIYPWVVGDELYKAYQDPSLTCAGPYPFTVETIYLPLIYLHTGIIYISVDIETVDLSDPLCPKPGSLLTISPLYDIALEENFYMITIPLDSPVVVNGPYFVGVYFGAAGLPDSAAVVTDTIPVPCVSYNDWGEGYVDLDTVHTDLGEKIFPGRLILYSGGTTGGSGGPQPAPAAQFINPVFNQSLGTTVDLWSNDAAGSEIIDRAEFQYFADPSWIDIGFDDDDASPLRNGVIASGSGDGLSYRWTTTGLAEDNYQLRVIISDTLGRTDTAEAPVEIDPTPPIPEVVEPVLGQNGCGGIAAEYLCDDEDITYISFERKSIPLDFSLPIPVVSQFLGGDANGNPEDGNSAAAGEYGDYCSGPAAGAMAFKYWFNKGYDYILREGTTTITDTLLMERLYTAMNIRDNLGAYDEEVVAGLRTYIMGHGAQFELKINRRPSANDLYSWMGDYEYVVLVGLSGNPGLWMTAAGSVGLADPSGQFTFKMANPVTGIITSYSVKEDAGKLWLLYNSVWSEIDILIGVVPLDWIVTRSAIGVDAVGDDGWGFFWNTSSLSEDSLYFLFAGAFDQAGNEGNASVLVQIDCTVNGTAGDINHDGDVNAADIVYMTNFLYMNGTPPPGGYSVTDINCDSSIDLSDVIYLFNYLFNSGPPPCP
jgi:hypothetical protein